MVTFLCSMLVAHNRPLDLGLLAGVAGDNGDNMQCMGFVSFDIRELGGAAVASATLSFTLDKKWGKPEEVWPALVLSELIGAPGQLNGLIRFNRQEPFKISAAPILLFHAAMTS